MGPDDVSDDLLDKAIDDSLDAHFTRYIDGILSRISGRIQKRLTRRKSEARFPEKEGVSKWTICVEDCEWWRLVTRLRSETPRDADQRTFRRRFRVPFEVFQELLDAAKSSGEFDSRAVGGHRPVPLELKLMGVLRYNAVGGNWDVIEEASGGISKSTFARFHLKYIEWFNRTQLDKYVYPTVPKVAEAVYSKLGFPGCVGSMDGVHIVWEGCPWTQKHLYQGKEKQPTMAFNVVCDTTTRVQSISGPFHGKVNDKTMVRCDAFVSRLRSDPVYKRLAFELCEKHGVKKTWLGAYLICDGGYHQWRETMSAVKGTADFDEASFAARLESVRKDVEALFGRVKKRFRILKVPILFTNPDHVGHTFSFCLALHNRLLQVDGFDKLGEEDGQWIDDDVEEHLRRVAAKVMAANGNVDNLDADLTRVGSSGYDDGSERTETTSSFFDLREALVRHWKFAERRWRKTGAELGLGFQR